jgi:hypothetical protein
MTRRWGGRRGEGVRVEGGSLGKRGGGDSSNSSQLRRWSGKTTPFGCQERRQEERQGEHRSKGTSAATTGDLLRISFWQGGCDCKEAEVTAVGGG